MRISDTSSSRLMLACLTTPLFFCPISAARKGHLEPAGALGWPHGISEALVASKKTTNVKNVNLVVESPPWWLNVRDELTALDDIITLLKVGGSGGDGTDQRFGCQVHHDRAPDGVAHQSCSSLLEECLWHASQERAAEDGVHDWASKDLTWTEEKFKFDKNSKIRGLYEEGSDAYKTRIKLSVGRDADDQG